MKSIQSTAVLLLTFVAVTEGLIRTAYNGNMRFFIADLAATYPCSPLYEAAYTDIGAAIPNSPQVKDVLEGLVDAGFNGIRLPMWPDSPREERHNSFAVDHEKCNEMSKNIAKIIQDADRDDKYHDMFIHMAPGYDNMLYQRELSAIEYAEWVLGHYLEIRPSFVSPFSGNVSPLANTKLDKDSKMQDAVTMFELDVFTQLRNLDWLKPFYPEDERELIKLPIYIGPDRATVQHSLNVLESFNDELTNLRPEYRLKVDVIGTQARYGDQTAVSQNYNLLRGNTTAFMIFCSLGSQEWYRRKEMTLGYSEFGLQYSRVPNGFWTNYKKYWGEPQPPASQVLEAGLTGYVAEAAVPRFVSKNGNVNGDRSWAKEDKMVDIDGYRQTYLRVDQTCIGSDCTKNEAYRNEFTPLSNVRESTKEMIFSDPCERYGDQPDDRIVKAYSTCSMLFTKRLFELNDDNDITAYVNTPVSVNSFREICTARGCETRELYIGVDHYLTYDPEKEERWIFENDSARDMVFQVEYLDATRNLVWGGATDSMLMPCVAAVLLAISAVF